MILSFVWIQRHLIEGQEGTQAPGLQRARGTATWASSPTMGTRPSRASPQSTWAGFLGTRWGLLGTHAPLHLPIFPCHPDRSGLAQLLREPDEATASISESCSASLEWLC